MDAARKHVRNRRRIPWLETLSRDAALARRSFRRNWVFSLAATATLAIGIGANTAVFSVLNAVLLKPLGVPDADRVVVLGWLGPQGLAAGASPATFELFSAQTEVLRDVAAFRSVRLNYLGGEDPEQIMAALVSEGFFRCFALPIAEGRGFLPEEMLPGAPSVTVISRRLRERSFAPGAAVLGERIELGGVSYEVIGVTGAGFDLGQLREFNAPPLAYLPLEIAPGAADPAGAFVNAFRVAARLRDGTTLEQARDRLDASAQAFRERFAGNRVLPEQLTFGAEPFTDYVVDDGTRRTLLILAGAVAFVLLIACTNTANLFLVWAGSRTREMAVRVAVGAGRGRLIRQLLTESVLLFLVAGVLGLGLGIAGIRALLAVSTSGLPRVGEAGAFVVPDWRVLTFAVLVSALTGIVFGLMPALAAARVDVSSSLKDSGRGGGAGPGRARRLLVAGEVALAVVLLTGAGLLIRTQIAILSVDAGFDTRNTLLMMTTLDENIGDPLTQIERTLAELRELPGVEGATATCNPCLPLMFGLTRRWWFPEFPTEPGRGPASRWVAAGDGYFDVFGMTLLAGRTFDARDGAGTPPVVVINQRMLETFFRDGNAIGRYLTIASRPGAEQQPPREIIGVVGDVPDGDLRRPVTPRMYVPLAQLPDEELSALLSSNVTHWALRTSGNPYRYREPAEAILVNSMGAPVSRVQSGEDYVKRSLGGQRFNLLLMSMFAAAAVLLAAVGIFGLLAYTVEQRRREIGIRLALGADPRHVGRRTLGEGLAMTLAGAGAGMLASYWLVQILGNRLYEVEPRDPVVFAAVPMAALLVAVLACWIPARRASRIDPVRALRYD